MQTTVEWFWNEIAEVLPFTVDSTTAIKMYDKLQQAKEMEKQMVIDIVEKSRATGLTAEYLLLTYGSKGSDTYQ